MNMLVYLFAICLVGTFLFAACRAQENAGGNDVNAETPGAANLILQPTIVNNAANQIDDATLLTIFEETFCSKEIFVYSSMNGEGIQTDVYTVPSDTSEGTNNPSSHHEKGDSDEKDNTSHRVHNARPTHSISLR